MAQEALGRQSCLAVLNRQQRGGCREPIRGSSDACRGLPIALPPWAAGPWREGAFAATGSWASSLAELRLARWPAASAVAGSRAGRDGRWAPRTLKLRRE